MSYIDQGDVTPVPSVLPSAIAVKIELHFFSCLHSIFIVCSLYVLFRCICMFIVKVYVYM